MFNDEELKNTPQRYEKFMKEWNKKREEFNFTIFDNPDYTGMVVMKNITFNSMCAHHLLPFKGIGHIGYIPGKKICGASKLIRALEMFSHKPQTQEKLTVEVKDFLMEKLKPKGVMIVLEAKHDCMCIRGVKNPTSVMITSECTGSFKNHEKTREEFLQFIKN